MDYKLGYMSLGTICAEKRTIFPRAQVGLEEKCDLRGIDNVQGQISELSMYHTSEYIVLFARSDWLTRR